MIKHEVTLLLTVEADHDDAGLVASEVMGAIQKEVLAPGEDIELLQAEVVDS